jgi:N-acetylneuraminic acid mutarotase
MEVTSKFPISFVIALLAAAFPAFAAPQSPSISTKSCFKAVAPLPTTIGEHSVATINNDLYLIGGQYPSGNNGGAAADFTLTYNTNSNKWTSHPPLPIPYHHSNVAAVDGKVYVLGGYTGKTGWIASEKSYSYDPAAERWSELADAPIKRGSAAVGVHGKTIWLAGGETTPVGAGPKTRGSTNMKPLADVASYDIAANKWTVHPDISLPEEREHAGGAVIGDVMYVVGGRRRGKEFNRDTVFALNLAAPKRWESLKPMPSKRGGMGVAALGKKIYTFGGEWEANGTTGVFNNVEVYDTVSNSWTVETPMRAGRHGFGAAAIGDIVYLVGGGAKAGGSSPTNLVEAYGPC